MKTNQMKIHREWKMVVQPSLAKLTWPEVIDEDLSKPVEYETLKWPPWLQKRIMEFRDQFIAKHEDVIPNVLVLQDEWIVSAQFSREDLKNEPKPQWVKDKIRELYEKLEEWQGQMLFEWYGLKVYNRHHVIMNRDLPMIFLEVRS